MSFVKSSIAIFVLTSISLNVFADQETAIFQALKSKIEQPINTEASYLADINSEAKRFNMVFENTDQVRDFYQYHGEHIPAIALTPATAPEIVEPPVLHPQSTPVAKNLIPSPNAGAMKGNELIAQHEAIAPVAPKAPVVSEKIPSPNAGAMKGNELIAQRAMIAPEAPVAKENIPSPNAGAMKGNELIAQNEMIAPKEPEPVVTKENIPSPSASIMKADQLIAQHETATDKTPAITGESYRSAVTQEQADKLATPDEITVEKEPHSTATKSPDVQATAITAKATAPVKASALTPSKQVVAASTLTASTKPVEQVKQVEQVQPTVTYINQGMTAKDRGELLATSHAVSNLAKRESAFEQSTNKRFSDLNKEVSNNKKEANAGISGAMAMANIPQVIQGQTVAIGAGMGGYNGENAVAVGVSARLSQNVTMKATVSDDTESNVGYGVGASIGW